MRSWFMTEYTLAAGSMLEKRSLFHHPSGMKVKAFR